ncbi:putative type IX secretion system sortase PorU2 [Dyadobacter psychrotolerans]|uniref:T9SS type A sorting domain-containing protein n=1 Tax=Dyadobacter psychrotolerans TaxID=2541721 RepID=A0A4R5DGP1_9BACT|nr:C25 family cysteine peptidase [Dyadobacter psychrotolerans]TDE11081.1 T9SS type A sorting domain-containing protein [Dyadobacter psychrotolerans]
MKISTMLKLAFIVSLLTFSVKSNAQYANDWLNDKFDQTFVKIGVQNAGLQKITFTQLGAAGLTVNSANKELLNVYYRGQLVKIVRINENDFEFYAEKNDGSRDSLLYRPVTARINRYYSHYSDLGSYFVTIGKATQKAVSVVQPALSGDPLGYHLKTDLTLFNTATVDYSHGPWQLYYPFPSESFLKDGETMTGPFILGQAVVTNNFSVPRLVTGSDVPFPKLDLMINGRQNGTQKVKVLLGSSTVPAFTFNFNGFTGAKTQISIDPQTNISNGQGSFSVQGDVGASDVYRFSLTYYTLTYPQQTDMQSGSEYLFTFPGTTNTASRIKILNVPSNPTVIDISDPLNPKVVTATVADNAIDLMIPRETNKTLKLYITGGNVSNALISAAPFSKITPSSHNYLIITNADLRSKADEYAAYRASAAGGSFKTLVVDIKDVYNQFNYGEPSPLGIRQFTEYMLSQGIDDNHHLFLIGKAVSATRYLTKELPGYVPTMGYPGSDILLVAGLNGANADAPAIPIGRLATNDPADITNYLAKVKLYETKANKELWRKQVLHINGGHTNILNPGTPFEAPGQIPQFKAILEGLEPLVEDQNTFKGKSVKPYVKQGYVEPGNTVPVDISADLNAGVGMITYFGHGSPNDTDYDLGRFSAVASYNNVGKFPFMYFNGCGVSNIFANYGNNTTNPRQEALANTWVLANGKGAIANIGGTLSSYVEPTEKYLQYFYAEIFSKPDPIISGRTSATNRESIGKIMRTVAQKTLIDNVPATLDITNIHQSLLLGDPAIIILSVDPSSLPVSLTSFKGELVSPKEVLLSWTTSEEVNNKEFNIERSGDGKGFHLIGTVDGKGTTTGLNMYSLKDTSPLSGLNYYRLNQTDYDGKITTSRIITVKNEVDGHVIFPNPVSGNEVKVAAENGAVVKEWKLYDIKGTVIRKSVIGESILLNNVLSGQYILEVTTSDNVVTRKVVIRK